MGGWLSGWVAVVLVGEPVYASDDGCVRGVDNRSIDRLVDGYSFCVARLCAMLEPWPLLPTAVGTPMASRCGGV